jgi:hypothetical protein
MRIFQMRGWEAKGFTSEGGTVSPSLRQKKLSSLLTVINSNYVLYGRGSKAVVR